ncbi:MAG: ABC transporter substrate-binding protein [Methyloceanibacter sp.]
MRVVASLLVAFVTLAAPFSASAQQPGRVYRIGVLLFNQPTSTSAWPAVFSPTLRQHGYIEGQNVIIETRWPVSGQGFSSLVAELLALKVDIIVALGTEAALAAKQATTSVPVVFSGAGNPERSGLVASLAHPGGNVTGTSNQSMEWSAKQFQLLKEISPRATRIASLWDPANAAAAILIKEEEPAAKALGFTLIPLGVRDADDLERALARALSERVEVLNAHLPVLFRHHQRVFEFAAANRVAVIAGARVYAQSGALFTFGADIRDVIRHTATYVARILNGAKPADLRP